MFCQNCEETKYGYAVRCSFSLAMVTYFGIYERQLYRCQAMLRASSIERLGRVYPESGVFQYLLRDQTLKRGICTFYQNALDQQHL